MPSDKTPSFRRVIVPWYDSSGVCLTLLAAMVGVLFFAVIGIRVALAHPAYTPGLWVPALLAVLCAGVFVSTASRLWRRQRGDL